MVFLLRGGLIFLRTDRHSASQEVIIVLHTARSLYHGYRGLNLLKATHTVLTHPTYGLYVVQCILGLQCSFSCIKCNKTASCREREKEDKQWVGEGDKKYLKCICRKQM